MPKGLDQLKQKIWAKLKGKINPRTRKPYTESEAWAIATAQWKKMGRKLNRVLLKELRGLQWVFFRLDLFKKI